MTWCSIILLFKTQQDNCAASALSSSSLRYKLTQRNRKLLFLIQYKQKMINSLFSTCISCSNALHSNNYCKNSFKRPGNVKQWIVSKGDEMIILVFRRLRSSETWWRDRLFFWTRPTSLHDDLSWIKKKRINNNTVDKKMRNTWSWTDWWKY